MDSECPIAGHLKLRNVSFPINEVPHWMLFNPSNFSSNLSGQNSVIMHIYWRNFKQVGFSGLLLFGLGIHPLEILRLSTIGTRGKFLTKLILNQPKATDKQP